MSRHYIVLPAKIDAQIDGQARKLTSATIICGFDKFPTRHFFCNVSESLIPEHVDEPIWASVLDFNFDNVTSVNGGEIVQSGLQQGNRMFPAGNEY